MTGNRFRWDRWAIPVVIVIAIVAIVGFIVTIVGSTLLALRVNRVEHAIAAVDARAGRRIDAVEQRMSETIQRLDIVSQAHKPPQARSPLARPEGKAAFELEVPLAIDASRGTEILLTTAPLSAQKVFRSKGAASAWPQ